MRTHTIPVFPGDGVGPEVIAEGKKVLDAAAALHGFRIDWLTFPQGAEHYLSTGQLFSPEEMKELSKYRAIYFGACGDERVVPGVLEKGIVIALRMYFDQFINLRPIKLFPGVRGPLRDKTSEDIDFIVVRENTEDFYVAAGGRVKRGKHRREMEISRCLYHTRIGMDIDTDASEIGYQLGMISAEGCRRVMVFAFELARERKRHISLIDKANVLTDMYSLWREQFRIVASEFPDIQTDYYLVDAAAMWFVREPERFDVIVAPNMFGDILTDLGAAIQGGLGLAPGANINPNGTSMFEPIHGSAPPLRGKQIANPIATIWAGAMMLDFLGETAASDTVMRAIQRLLTEGKVKTPDLGGSHKTAEVGEAIASLLSSVGQ
ncbi:MAG: isocitrate/isopropylmalate dehydrogenase family protein [Candidatus Acidiferrales bacterium]